MQELDFAVYTALMFPARIELNNRLELVWPCSFQMWQGPHFHTCPYSPVRVVRECNLPKSPTKREGVHSTGSAMPSDLDYSTLWILAS
jgi:hypothetical protein